MKAVFNELSACGTCRDRFVAHDAMLNAVQAAIVLRDIGFDKYFPVTSDFATRKLCEGYTVSDWVYEKDDANIELKRFFKSGCSKKPYVENHLDTSGFDGDFVEYLFNGQSVLGMALAHIWSSPVLSIASAGVFLSEHFDVVRHVLNGESIDESLFAIVNFCDPAMVDAKKQNLRNLLREGVNTGNDIIEKSHYAFSRLDFCASARVQMRALRGDEPFFDDIKRHLGVVNDTICDISGGFRPVAIDYAATESERVMNNRRCKESRMFRCPDGISRAFWAHSKIQAYNKRIHMIPDVEARRVLIGYVGDHLPLP